ncbi:preprotachykinin-like [Homarus americanus]|uniref:Preprotachykinin-like n=1 Tax=Homarus americanus TaxID=6706 RepID=A0A8J5MMN2_HOMAM|nr:preprotachykinin-like [Homarus americanus]
MVRACTWAVLLGVVVVMGVVSAAGEGQDTPQDRERRAPSGFLGMRGKKDASTALDDNTAASEYSSLPDPYPLYGLRDNNLPMLFAVPWKTKKAPSGFLGMRGKKSDEEVFSDATADNDLEILLKRAPSGFLGMRGKKAPSGFLGMRGKKAPSGFLGMRGKKYYDDDSDMDAYIQALTAVVDGQQQQKRAPSGFLGMRGKKAYYSENPDEEISMTGVDKRTPSGFLGVRCSLHSALPCLKIIPRAVIPA